MAVLARAEPKVRDRQAERAAERVRAAHKDLQVERAEEKARAANKVLPVEVAGAEELVENRALRVAVAEVAAGTSNGKRDEVLWSPLAPRKATTFTSVRTSWSTFSFAVCDGAVRLVER